MLPIRSCLFLVLTALLWIPASGVGQVLDITGGIHAYPTLENATVTLGGHAELHVTAVANPMAGSTVNFISEDAWLFLENVRPSVVMSSYTGQFRVNDEVAIPGGNIRIVQYASGSVVIPHAPDFLPLEVFAGPHLQGASTPLGQLTYHREVDLGSMNDAISSFRLKCGYMATLAENEDGTGHSRVYVAQDPGKYPNLSQLVQLVGRG